MIETGIQCYSGDPGRKPRPALKPIQAFEYLQKNLLKQFIVGIPVEHGAVDEMVNQIFIIRYQAIQSRQPLLR
jgi:hypothetical protein